METITDLDPEKPNIKHITGISQLYNFQFHEDSIRMWKAFGIGEGKLYVGFFLICRKSININVADNFNIQILHETS